MQDDFPTSSPYEMMYFFCLQFHRRFANMETQHNVGDLWSSLCVMWICGLASCILDVVIKTLSYNSCSTFFFFYSEDFPLFKIKSFCGWITEPVAWVPLSNMNLWSTLPRTITDNIYPLKGKKTKLPQTVWISNIVTFTKNMVIFILPYLIFKCKVCSTFLYYHV